MTIADQLTTLNTTKQSIKTAIEAKGVTVGTVPFADYATKISEITGGGGGTYNPATVTQWSQELHSAVYDAAVAENAATAWTRPTDWLAMPAITATDQRFNGLVAVFNTETNWISITAAGDFTVDWGDGSPLENYSLGTQALHNYAWANVSAGTTTTEGFRQAIVTVTPQAGQALTAFNLGQPISTVPTGYSAAWLDIQVAMNNIGSFDFGSYTTGSRPRLLKRFRWLGLNDQGIFNNFCRNLTSLSIVEMDTTGATEMNDMFNSCYALQTISNFDTSTVTTASGMFFNCIKLLVVPPLNLSVCTNISSMFSGCKNLRTIGQWTLRPSTSGTVNGGSVFNACAHLLIVPNCDNTVFNAFSVAFSGCSEIVCIPSISITNATYTSMFANCFNLESITAIVPVTTMPTVIASMFINCYKLDPPGFNCASVTNSNNAFQNSNVSNITKFNFASTINSATDMFTNSSLAGSVTFSNAITGSAESVFPNCELITELNYSFIGNAMATFAGNCFNLKKATINITNTSTAISLASTFANCLNLQSVTINLTNVNSALSTSQSSLFNACANLREVIGLKFGTSTTTLPTNTFGGCTSLSKLRLDGLVATFSVASCALGPAALEELFTSLGTASAKTATITGNWGAPLLTQSQRNIAINKGWTIVG